MTVSSPSAPLAELALELSEDPSLLCKYPSKKCWNRRALKRNGEMHNLCDLHREKANKNQRRLELKRKTRAACSPASLGEARSLAPRPRSRQRKRSGAPRGVLSTHLAMREEARARQLESLLELRRSAYRGVPAALVPPMPSAFEPTLSSAFYPMEHPLPLRISTAPVDGTAEGAFASSWHNEHSVADDLALLCGALDTSVPAKAAVGSVTTSPVDVGEGWSAMDAAACWDLSVELVDSSDFFPIARV